MAPHRGRKRGDPARVLGVAVALVATVVLGGLKAWGGERGRGSAAATALSSVGGAATGALGGEAGDADGAAAEASRHLLARGAWDPLHTEPGYKGQLGAAGMVLWVPLTVWIFMGVAIVADEYFTPALEKISDALDLSPDVAGATFLAAASSAPEFFTSFADTFLVSDEGGEGFGVGTIVGSAVFNILIICAVSCIPASGEKKRRSPGGDMLNQHDFVRRYTLAQWEDAEATEKKAPTALDLDWYPLARDTVFYVASICLLIGTVATDEPEVIHRVPLQTLGCVTWHESLGYILLYCGYIVVMKFSARIAAQLRPIKDRLFHTNESGDFPQHESRTAVPSTAVQCLIHHDSRVTAKGRKSIPKVMLGRSAASMGSRRVRGLGGSLSVHVPVLDDSANNSGEEGGVAAAAGLGEVPAVVSSSSTGSDSDDDDTSPFWESLFDVPDGAVSRVFWALALPFNLAFMLTIPAVTRANVKQHYVVAFFMCILWIALLSAMMVKIVAWMGNILGIDSIVMGLVVLAAGTSVPDALGSYNEVFRGLLLFLLLLLAFWCQS